MTVSGRNPERRHRRGRRSVFVVVLLASIITIAVIRWTNSLADRHARVVRNEFVTALATLDRSELNSLVGPDPSVLFGIVDRSGGRWRGGVAGLANGGQAIAVDASLAWAPWFSRCIVVGIGEHGSVETRVLKRVNCDAEQAVVMLQLSVKTSSRAVHITRVTQRAFDFLTCSRSCDNGRK